MKAHLLRSAARSLLLPASLILATPVRALATAINIATTAEVCASATASSGGTTVSNSMCTSPPEITATAANGLAVADASGTQFTSVSPSSFSGLLRTSASTLMGLTDDSASAQGYSIFIVTFEVTVPHTYDLSGELNHFTEGFASSTPHIQFTGGTVNDMQSTTGGIFETVPFHFSGTLLPGVYTLLARSQDDAFADALENAFSGTGQSGVGFELTLTEVAAVPEPSALALFASGGITLLGMFGRRKKA